MILVFLFVLGISIGSFLNVLIDRLPNDKSVIYGRSYCDHCKKKLKWYDLIPVLSYFLLNRKCRYCKKPISWQYPLIELITGVIFILTGIYVASNFRASENLISVIYLLTVFSGLFVIFVTDLKYGIIPDELLVVISLAALIYTIIFHPGLIITNFLIGIAFSALFLFLLVITKGKGMGMGDVKFALFMGFFLGYPGIVVAFYSAFLTGAFISSILVLGKVKKLKSTVPFGPFLVGATVVSYIWGNTIWAGVLRWMGI